MRLAVTLSLAAHGALLFGLEAAPPTSPQQRRRLEWTEAVEARTPPPLRPAPVAVRPTSGGALRRRGASAPAPVDPGPGRVELPTGAGEAPLATAGGENEGTSDAGALVGGASTVFVLPPTRPQLLDEVRPEYPEALRDDGVQGDVELEVTIDVDGQVASVRIVQAVDATLAESAAQAIRRSRWLPGTKEGAPARATVRYVYTFVLE